MCICAVCSRSVYPILYCYRIDHIIFGNLTLFLFKFDFDCCVHKRICSQCQCVRICIRRLNSLFSLLIQMRRNIFTVILIFRMRMQFIYALFFLHSFGVAALSIDLWWNDVTLTRIKFQLVFRSKCDASSRTASQTLERSGANATIILLFLLFFVEENFYHSLEPHN